MAVSYFRRLLRSDTENINIHTDLGITLMRLDDIQGACDHFSEAVRIDPENAEAHYNLGLTFFKQERMDKAAEQYLKSLRIRPQNASSHYNLAIVLHRRGDFEGAIGHFEHAMRLNSGLKLQASYNIARAYARQGKTGESVKCLQRAVAAGFNNWTDLETDKHFKNIRDTLYYRKIIWEKSP
jgi:tetratricopeptide (TPR) repeat protein